MRFGEKIQMSQQGTNEVFGVDFHDFIQKENNSTSVELATEFGLTLGDVRKLKKQLHRS
ncbi:hypothetical protein PY093_08780 [Cytobacillus sp. S13-E01]|uniref:hypothetical protein n=1 Tax=Cytobacillus sp. S13-E01 TaxID=3031326 RepID=UPI0023D810AC|nr:hypothetical protein [Cytobacillus sp. S13-E01]MDF0726808.1 hypothetical protein [Cytobacillus sp. S13-E01]